MRVRREWEEEEEGREGREREREDVVSDGGLD